MIKRLLEYILGWLKISITGDNLERFLNICNYNDIKMKNVLYADNLLNMKIQINDFRKLKDISKKTKVHIKIEERYGLPFFLFKNRKRKMFFAGIISSFVIVYILSLRIWQISFDGNYSHTADELLSFLASKGIVSGIEKEDCVADEIEKSLRNKYSDIKWASVEIIGTRMIVHIKENHNELNEETDNNNYSIVSNKDAKIISIVTGKGTPMVKAGDTVKVGDVLIAGYYNIMSDYEELLGTEYVKADGTIMAETVYKIDKKISRTYEKKIYTDNISKKYIFKAFNKDINIDWFSEKYKLYDIVDESNQLVIGENFYLPIYWINEERREYKIEDMHYNDTEAYNLGQKNVNEFLQNLIEKGIQITQNNVTIEVNENDIVISGEVICYEYIGEKRIENNE